MNLNFLDFEQPIAELEAKIEELRYVGSDNEINIGDEIARLKSKSHDLTESIFSNLKASQIAQLSRHPQRPYFMDTWNAFSLTLKSSMVTVLMQMMLL